MAQHMSDRGTIEGGIQSAYCRAADAENGKSRLPLSFYTAPMGALFHHLCLCKNNPDPVGDEYAADASVHRKRDPEIPDLFTAAAGKASSPADVKT